jgi:hypothetical protein
MSLKKPYAGATAKCKHLVKNHVNMGLSRKAVFAYIEGFYNARRAQKRSGCLSHKQRLKMLDGRVY